MTQTSAAATEPLVADAAAGGRRSLRFAIVVAVVLLVYASASVGTVGVGYESISDAGVERTGPFRGVMVTLEPSRLVLGIAIGAALAVLAAGRLMRAEVAIAVQGVTLAVIVVVAIAATVAGWLWIRGFEPGAAVEELRDGIVAIPWPLDASVTVERW